VIKMIQRETFVIAALALCAASCGGKAVSCSISFSGSFSGSYSCTATAAYNSGGGAGGNTGGVVALLANGAGALSYYSFGMNTTADLHTGTYAPGALTTSSGSLILANGQSFAQTSVQSTLGPGNFSLNVASLDTVATTGGNKVYLVHGTLDETLVASSTGASGQVAVHASF
jgi:hypothetical protein